MMFEQERKMENEMLKPSSSNHDEDPSRSNVTEKPNDDKNSLKSKSKSTSQTEEQDVNNSNTNKECSPHISKRSRPDDDVASMP